MDGVMLRSNNRLRREAVSQGRFATLKGYLTAKIWIVAPPLISLPIMRVFGEGSYIVPILAVLWMLSLVVGLRIRARAELGTRKRSQGNWVSIWSFLLALLMVFMTVVLIAEGNWQSSPPDDHWSKGANGS